MIILKSYAMILTVSSLTLLLFVLNAFDKQEPNLTVVFSLELSVATDIFQRFLPCQSKNANFLPLTVYWQANTIGLRKYAYLEPPKFGFRHNENCVLRFEIFQVSSLRVSGFSSFSRLYYVGSKKVINTTPHKSTNPYSFCF